MKNDRIDRIDLYAQLAWALLGAGSVVLLGFSLRSLATVPPPPPKETP